MITDLVLIHGFWSSPTTWDRLATRIAEDPDLCNLRVHRFGYLSPRMRLPGLPSRIPDYDDIAQTLPAYLDSHIPDPQAALALVTHSQGGLILQRFLTWMLAEGRGRELAWIRLIAMLACPNEGSEYLRSIRAVAGFGRHPQAKALRVLDTDVGEARRIVLRQIINTSVLDERNCRIPFYVYSGASDNVVSRESAQSVFPDSGVLPGDHFSILNPDAPGNLTLAVLKRHLLSKTSERSPTPNRSGADTTSTLPQEKDGTQNETMAALTLDKQALTHSLQALTHSQLVLASRLSGPVPRQLPPTTAGFVGRESESNDLYRLLADKADSRAILISAISGMGGVGKTALAVKWAHDMAHRFPDGQLFVDLRGHDPVAQPREPAEVLDELLMGMHVKPDEIPTQLSAKTTFFRSLIANRRILILLDNAISAKQVRPVLPASDTALVLITSRSQLSGLVAREGLQRIHLGILPEDEAIKLIRLTARDHHALSPRSSLAQLARLCSYLPLALRIAGEKISDHLGDLDTLVRDLSDQGRRLSTLGGDDDEYSEVRAVFFWSYRDLPADAARMFRLIGLHSGPEIGIGAAAALANVSRHRASNTLNKLSSANVIDYLGAGRYRMHDLLRLYARERAECEEVPEEKFQAVARVLTWYLHGADAADRVLRSARMRPTLDPLDANISPEELDTHADAMRWCETEGDNLASGVVQAAEFGLHSLAWKLPISMWGYLTQSRRWSNWVAPYAIAQQSAHQLGDNAAEAWTTHNLGQVYRELRLYAEAQECYTRALTIRRESGDRWGEAHTLTAIGACQLDRGNPESSIGYLDESLIIHEELSDPSGRGATLERLGEAYRSLQDFPRALSFYERALAVWVEIKNPLWEGWVLDSLGLVSEAEGDSDKAIQQFRRALSIHRRIMQKHGIASILTDLGRNLIGSGQKDEGRACWCEALELFHELDDARALQLRALIERLDLSAQ